MLQRLNLAALGLLQIVALDYAIAWNLVTGLSNRTGYTPRLNITPPYISPPYKPPPYTPGTIPSNLEHIVPYGRYSVIGPGTIRSNFKYNVAVTLHKAEGPCKIDVSVTGLSYNATKRVELQPMSTQKVEFNVPTLKEGDYKLTAKGVSGITFENSTKLNYADYKPATYIQTDKATYKPGDVVQFRVFLLDENTRPAAIQQPITIVINDGAGNRIKQFKDVKLTKGVFTGKLQLSEQPVLGNWNIKVNIDGEAAETKTFEVEKYVLPKFEVSIETAKDVPIADGVIKVTVRAKYTYGKSVKGKASVSIKPDHNYSSGSKSKMAANKTIDVDGKGHFEFDLMNDLGLSSERSFLPPLNVLAIMEEEFTGNKQNATATVKLHKKRYRIEGVNVPRYYEKGKPTTVTIIVKNMDGSPVRDAKHKAKLFVTRILTKPRIRTVFVSTIDENGMATFEFTLNEANIYDFYSLKTIFMGTTEELHFINSILYSYESQEALKMKVISDKPRLGKMVSVEVKSSDNLTYYAYVVVARGNILKSEYVQVPEGTKSDIIKFMPTVEMTPKATIYVYYVFGKDLRFDEETINFEKEFENTINITAPLQVKPGEEVQLEIATDPDSFVGLLGVDQSVLLLKSGNDINKGEVFKTLSNYDAKTPVQHSYGERLRSNYGEAVSRAARLSAENCYGGEFYKELGHYPGEKAGVVTLTNAHYRYKIVPISYSQVMLMSSYHSESALISNFAPTAMLRENSIAAPINLRKTFLENWIFENFDTDGNTTFNLTKKVPDTITSWVVTGFSLNPKTGLALTADPTKIKVFQPFFVSTSLPYSVKRGEVIAVPVIIFNYMDTDLDAEVVMDNTDKEYDFTEATNEVEENLLDEIKRTKHVSVPSATGKSVSFMIRPKKVGQITLKITATTPLAGDAIHQTLKVEPDGVTQYENRAIFINLKDNPEFTDKLTVDVPIEAVPDSEYIEFTVVGDLLGPTVKNLDNLVRMPYGCGEQNMMNFVPNILVLRYLDALGRDMPTVNEKAKKFLEIGYQRELTYKHGDGSYSAFGKSDINGSTWLTAYVVRSFAYAQKYTDIDERVIEKGLDFLVTKQGPNGSFTEHGRLLDCAHQNELGLTAFVLLAFLNVKRELQEKYKQPIDLGLSYLTENVDQTDDQYSLSIAALALQISNIRDSAAAKVLTKLEGLANQENDRKWWSKKREPHVELKSSYYRPHSYDVEITSYVLLTVLARGGAENPLPIVKWLISQRNSNGGFSSTQDTVVGLLALITFAEKTATGEMDIEFVSSGGSETKGTIQVNTENSLLVQTHVLPKTTRQINLTARGKGSAMAQLSYRYNLADKDKKPSFQVKTNVKGDKPTLVLEICAEYAPEDVADGEQKESNMVVMEVALPSGYTADTDSFEAIGEVDRVKRTETKNSESTVIVYFDSLPTGEVKCIPMQASKTHAVAKQKPAAVNVYDYYDTNLRATEYYQVQSSLCDICEGDDCGESCRKVKESRHER